MGEKGYDTGIAVEEGKHVYCHSRKDGKDGYVYLVINNSNEATTIEMPKDSVRYTLSGDGKMRSRTMCLNGKPLELLANDELPELSGVEEKAGEICLEAGTCTFFVI